MPSMTVCFLLMTGCPLYSGVCVVVFDYIQKRLLHSYSCMTRFGIYIHVHKYINRNNGEVGDKTSESSLGTKMHLLYTMYGFEWTVENNNKKMLLWTQPMLFWLKR